jgi:hypothetical protein
MFEPAANAGVAMASVTVSMEKLERELRMFGMEFSLSELA